MTVDNKKMHEEYHISLNVAYNSGMDILWTILPSHKMSNYSWKTLANIHDHNTRHKSDNHAIAHRIHARTMCIKVYGAKHWNSRYQSLKKIQTLINNFRNTTQFLF